jgi:hypothetical protein
VPALLHHIVVLPAQEIEANTYAMVEGITTVRVICYSPRSRATLTKPSSIERAPSNVLENTRNTTTIHEVTMLRRNSAKRLAAAAGREGKDQLGQRTRLGQRRFCYRGS